jgi:adenine-specific DNA-methyltransferase
MSRINDLIRQVAREDPKLAEDLRSEVDALSERRSFGLNFERHVPESVELPGRPVRRGDKVRVLPPRGEKPGKEQERLWKVIELTPDGEGASIEPIEGGKDEDRVEFLEDLVVVAEFRDPIYPGLVSTGKVERGGDKPFHTVINAENYHALQALLYTHRGKVDAIYIDPPYNTGARDWKYNNDYVDQRDLWRHSLWLSFMEKRLQLAADLLSEDGVLIVTIDHNEQHRLNMLIEDVLPSHEVTTVVIQHNPRGIQGDNFAWTHEYALFVTPSGRKVIGSVELDEPELSNFRNWGGQSLRSDARNCFYPVIVDPKSSSVVGFGDVLPDDVNPPAANEEDPEGLILIWPIDGKGIERKWRYARQTVEGIKEKLRTRIGGNGVWTVEIAKTSGPVKTVWTGGQFDAGTHGTRLLSSLIPGRKFPFPKSLYSVEQALEISTQDKPNAIVLDFFAGSGSTAHAVMRLNRRDGGSRTAISVTNNEISEEDQKRLRKEGFRPGDSEWETRGICDFITTPRIEASITGLSPDGEPVGGEYRFKDPSPIADGFEENVEFFRLTYEAPLAVKSNRDFERIAPLLWMRAGSVGRRIEDVSSGWDVAESYGVLADLDETEAFLEAVSERPTLRVAFIVTDDNRLFEALARDLPEEVEPVRLYESYLKNFEIATARSSK